MIKNLILILCMGLSLYAQTDRTEIGALAYVKVADENISFLSRIDSGARITSLHAINIKLEGPRSLIRVVEPKPLKGLPFLQKHKNEEYKRNVGRMISFDTLNERGEKKHIKARVINVVRVKNAQGIEYRYVIGLGLEYKGILKYKEVNLRDRSHMSFKLLIGRNWLNDDFLIRTDKQLIKQ